MHASLFLTTILLFGQTSSFAVDDIDKHGFAELAAIHIDVDRDGRPDTIQPRTYTRRFSNVGSVTRESHWIAFDLLFATGRKRASFFTYRYGDDRADYWVWALKPAGDLNLDGRLDLLFYSGDDTTDETIVLLQGARRFVASSSGLILCDTCVLDRDFNVLALGQYDATSGLQAPNRLLARWNPRRGYFEGSGLYWVRAGRVALRETPSSTARVVAWFSKDDAVASTVENGQPVVKGRWVKVESDMGPGWLDRASLVTTSRWVRP